MQYYHLTGIDEGKREIYVANDDETITVTIDASQAAWTGKETDLEIIMAPNGATVYYYDENGAESYKNYQFGEDGAVEV